MPVSVHPSLPTLAGSLLLATVLISCSAPPGELPQNLAPSFSGSPSAGSTSAPATSTPTPTPAAVDPVTLTSNVKDGSTKVKVDTLVSAKASAGTLSEVKLSYAYTDGKGTTQKGSVSGELNKNKTEWVADERLEPAASYKLTMVGSNAVKEKTEESTSFKTQNLTLSQQTFASLYPLPDSLVGIGMPVVVNFDVPVKNKKEFERNLVVKSSPAQKGTWHWYNDREVRFRPAKFWKPGTEVKVQANLNGLNAGGGIYGQSSETTSFEVGRSFVTKVDLAKKVAKVYRNGDKVRTIPISAGKNGWQTRSGTKLVMAKEYNKKMTNEMIGAKEDYSLTAQYAIRITNSGEFLHSAPWNAGYFGRSNASHGCVGMSNSNAGWLYERVLIGDPVITTGSSRKLEKGNGYSDWNISYKQYKKGSSI